MIGGDILLTVLILCRQHPEHFLEALAEIGWRGESYLCRDIFDRNIGVCQNLCCAFKTYVAYEFGGSLPGLVMKLAVKAHAAHAYVAAEALHIVFAVADVLFDYRDSLLQEFLVKIRHIFLIDIDTDCIQGHFFLTAMEFKNLTYSMVEFQ